jgi:hypothetical protein
MHKRIIQAKALINKRLDGKRGLLGAATVALLLISISLLAGVKANRTVAALPAEPVATPESLAAGQVDPTRSGRQVRTVRFKLFDLGILPREARVENGLVAIITEDYWGGGEGVIVERENGPTLERVGQVRRGHRWRSRSEIRLTPGRYQVYMTDRPENRALLIVEP